MQRKTQKKKKNVNSMNYDHVTVVNRYPILQLSIDHNMDGCYQVKHRLQAPTLARKFDILHWLSCGTDGQTDRCTVMCNLVPRSHSVLPWEIWVRDYSHVITKISGMDR